MGAHWQATNDPTNPTGRQNHTPDFGGTSAQRLAYPTASLIWGDQWTETDTGLTWKWTSSWGLMASSMGNSSMVVAGTFYLVSGQLVLLNSGVEMLIM
jgi:hypothetical protein